MPTSITGAAALDVGPVLARQAKSQRCAGRDCPFPGQLRWQASTVRSLLAVVERWKGRPSILSDRRGRRRTVPDSRAPGQQGSRLAASIP